MSPESVESVDEVIIMKQTFNVAEEIKNIDGLLYDSQFYLKDITMITGKNLSVTLLRPLSSISRIRNFWRFYIESVDFMKSRLVFFNVNNWRIDGRKECVNYSLRSIKLKDETTIVIRAIPKIRIYLQIETFKITLEDINKVDETFIYSLGVDFFKK